MPSAIKLKKLTASNWAAENKDEEETPEGGGEPETAETEKAKQKKKLAPGPSMFDVEILNAKRKRTVPLNEQKLMIWLEENFETKEEGFISKTVLYENYTESCVLDGSNVVDQNIFNKYCHDSFGDKGLGVKDESPYKGLIPEKKKKKKGPVKKADSLKLKMKDIVIEALTEGKSPKKGLRFQWLKHYIAGKYPALRVDLDPHYLKTALERAVRFGHVELVRGMGMVGFYRLPGEYPDDEEDEKKKKPKKKKEEEKKKGEGEAKEGEVKEEEEPKEGEETKAQNGEEEAESGEKEETKDKGKKKKAAAGDAKAKKKSRKKRPKRPVSYVSRHVEPRSMADTFPMAMTFMCDPKDASSTKIKNYIIKYFPSTNLENHMDRFKRALLNGCEKGLWEQVTGSGMGGSFRLQVDDINPTACTTLEDMICLAILACHEPKQSSAILLKQYIKEFHPEFKVEERGKIFGRAIEKALREGVILRLSGIGRGGTFQLTDPFTPCPNWLGGEESDEEDYEEPEEIVAMEEQSYRARPSKRKGRGRAAAAKGRAPDFISYSGKIQTKARKPAKSTSVRKPAVKAKYKEDSDEDESDEEEVVKPSTSRSRGGSAAKSSTSRSKARKAPAKAKARGSKTPKRASGGKKAKASKVDDSEEENVEEEEEENVEEEEEKPKKSKSPAKGRQSKSTSRGGSKDKKRAKGRKVEDDKAESSEEEGEVLPPARSRERKNYSEESDEEIISPSKSRSRGGDAGKSSKSRSKGGSSGRKKYTEDDDEVSEEEMPKSSKSKSRGAASGRKKYTEDDAESEEEMPKSSKSRGASSGRKKYTEDDAESEEEMPKPSKSRGASSGRKKYAEEDVESEEEESPKSSKSKGSSSRGKKRVVEDDSEEETSTPPKSAKKSGSHKKKRADDDSDDETMPSPSKSKSKGGSSKKRRADSDSEEEGEVTPARASGGATRKRLGLDPSDSEEEEGEVRPKVARYDEPSDEELDDLYIEDVSTTKSSKSPKKPASKSKKRR